MLLNLSNHPSANWSANQKEMAEKFYHTIRDMPFPLIPPEFDSKDIDLLVQKYEHEIRNINPTCVHIMGELVFTFQLVGRLKKINISCIASTTSRISTEKNGVKTSEFQFVQFRDY